MIEFKSSATFANDTKLIYSYGKKKLNAATLRAQASGVEEETLLIAHQIRLVAHAAGVDTLITHSTARTCPDSS